MTTPPIDYEKTNTITSIDYNELESTSSINLEDNLLEKIGVGFGNFEDSLGIIIVKNIPNFTTLRSQLLLLSHQLANDTPKRILEEMTVPSANYQVGWSHGQERVEGEHKFDTAKGSFYANPLSDNVLGEIVHRDFPTATTTTTTTATATATGQNSSNNNNQEEDEKAKDDFIRFAHENPAFYASNVWPQSLPALESSFKEMGQLIHSIGRMLAKLCDAYVLKHYPKYDSGKIGNVIEHSMCCKGRLLHYFPIGTNTVDETTTEDNSFSSWCGWHNDHCSLTGLVPAMYIDSRGNEIDCPDTSAGLYITSRKGKVVHVNIPTDCLAFQIGETAQIHTGGLLQATPHAVRGCNQNDDKCRGVSREAFAVFMEPEFYGDMDIPEGRCIEDAQGKEAESHLPPTVKTLQSRWRNNMNFGQFSNATFAAFY